MTRLPAFLISATICACASTNVNGYHVGEDDYNEAVRVVKSRASFDFSCSEAIETTLLGASAGYANTIGVVACGQKAVYSRNGVLQQWVLNSASE